jgi:HK97 family phage portal protein
MAILDDLKKAIGMNSVPNQKAGPVVMYSEVGYTSGKKQSYADYASEGYQENAVVYRCINEISQGAASVKMEVFDGDTKLDEHPLLTLLYRPNPLMAGCEYFQALYTQLLISGNAYALRVGAENQPPKELYFLRPDRVKIKSSGTMTPRRYDYCIGGKVKASYDVDQETGQSEVKHIKLYNPLDDYYGLSPIHAAAHDIDQHNMAAKHNVALLQNGARPSGAIIFKPKDEAGMSVQLSESQRQQLIQDMESRFKGSQNAGRAMLLEGDFDWREMGLSPKDMDFLQLKNMSARDIALCFGVPSQLVGVPDSQTYANVQEARLALYEETIIPLLKRMESDLTEWLGSYYGDNISIRYDIDSIPAMAERRKKVYENVSGAVELGIISRNEAREKLGLEPITGGDDVYISAGLFPLGSAEVSPEEESEEEPEEEITPIQAGEDAYGEES